MSTYRFDRLFAARSIVLAGASPRDGSLGRIVLGNLRRGGFEGPIYLVDPHDTAIDGAPCYARIGDIPPPADLLVVTAPPAAVPDLLDDAGRAGMAGAVVLSAGLGHGPGSIAEAASAAADRHGLRVIGPNCLGLQLPKLGIDASFASRLAPAGDLALLSQSGTVAAATIEWAAHRGIGFSAVVSLGDSIDVDVGDCLDHFAIDGATRAILLYVESISNATKFMSAARAAARVKPVVVMKAGRHAAGAKAAATHTGALAGSDAVYDAAFRRAGLLRAFDLDELFAAAETLGRRPTFLGERLGIVTNGGGIGVLAVDRLADLGGRLAALGPATIETLDKMLPPTWSRGNPVDVSGDADGARYGAAVAAMLADPDVDAVLVLNCPTAVASAFEAATSVIAAAEAARRGRLRPKPVFAVWLSDDVETQAAFETARIPSFRTEADAVRGFMHLVRYRRGLDLLMEAPPSLPEDFVPDREAASAIVRAALADGREWLEPVEVANLLAAYEIPVLPVALAPDPDAAARIAEGILAGGGACVVKIASRDIIHKSDIGGVQLNLATPDAVRGAAAAILERARARRPDARIDGVLVQAMIVRPKARELIAGLADDPTFGPVIVFGRGGTAVELIDDKALALPPLDLNLARQLIARTRVSRILAAYRDVPAADATAIAMMLVKLSQLAADVPEIRELDLNPVLADASGVLAVDARARIAPSQPATGRLGHPRFAIRPYPREWERRVTLSDGTPVFIRPVKPEDEAIYQAFFRRISPEDLRLRFFGPVKEFTHAFIARLTQIDYARAIAFAALSAETGELLGGVRLHTDVDHVTGEYAILVRSDLKGRGLGWTLMKLLIEYAAADGVRTVSGQVLDGNRSMLDMCRALGFEVRTDADDIGTWSVTLDVASAAKAAGA